MVKKNVQEPSIKEEARLIWKQIVMICRGSKYRGFHKESNNKLERDFQISKRHLISQREN